jgi:geranylgeranyl diphosphate synthase type I
VDAEGQRIPCAAGKAIRPTLCLLACEAVSGDYRRALPAAAALELIHNYSLIHDDIQDDDSERRHRPTVWKIWGKPQAINAGTAMRLLANRALAHFTEKSIGPQKQWQAQRLLDDINLRLLEGQYLDISFESRFDIAVSDYLKMIEGKTAALLAGSLEIGALLGTDDTRLIRSFHEIGHNMGMAFQIKDDILGIWGCAEKTGKPLGSDIRRRKKTLPIIYTLEISEDGLKKKLAGIYGNGHLGKDDLSTVMRILDTVEAQLYAQRMVERYCEQARRALNTLELVPSARDNLEAVLDFLIARDF